MTRARVKVSEATLHILTRMAQEQRAKAAIPGATAGAKLARMIAEDRAMALEEALGALGEGRPGHDSAD